MDTLVLWVSLAILAFLLRKPFVEKVLPALDARGERIRAELDEAQRLREEAKAMLDKYRAELEAGEGAAEAILKQSAEDTARIEAKMREELETAVRRRTQQATDRIAQEELRAKNEVRDRAADLAVRSTRRLLESKLDRERADVMISGAIREVEAKL